MPDFLEDVAAGIRCGTDRVTHVPVIHLPDKILNCLVSLLIEIRK